MIITGIARLAMDRSIYDPSTGRRIIIADRMALDRSASARRYDADGHLHIERSPISKANVCEYYGSEIPDAEALGLDPTRRYRLLRDPEELQKAAASSNGKQLLLGHMPVSADDPQKHKWVGSTGTDAEYVHPYLYNSLHLHDRDGIAAIETADQDRERGAKELSSAYRYRADMTPGVYEGAAYDGVMRDIDFNHVALVPEGRAGADVVVGDSQIVDQKEILMSNKVLSRFAGASMVALGVYLRPKLAQDAKIDLGPLFDGVSKKNFDKKKIAAAVTDLTKGKLAQDASLADVTELLDHLEKCDVPEGADADPASGLPLSAEELAKKGAADEEDEDEEEKKKKKEAMDAFRAGLGADQQAAFDAIMGTKPPAAADAEESEKDKPVDKKAMDAAIAKTAEDTANRVRREMTELAEAREFVQPWAGKLSMALDSAEKIHRAALDVLGVAHKGIHPDALKPILMAQPKPGEQRRIAQDAAEPGDSTGFNGRWGAATDRIGVA